MCTTKQCQSEALPWTKVACDVKLLSMWKGIKPKIGALYSCDVGYQDFLVVIGYPTIMRILRPERPADLPGTSNVIVEVVGVEIKERIKNTNDAKKAKKA
ncbi:hypothetical protein Tco_0381718 [Tanacetum coccineum]